MTSCSLPRRLAWPASRWRVSTNGGYEKCSESRAAHVVVLVVAIGYPAPAGDENQASFCKKFFITMAGSETKASRLLDSPRVWSNLAACIRQSSLMPSG